MIHLLLRGMVIGVAIAAPVGPIGVLCVRRTLNHGQIAGVVSGLGAATADAVYGGVAAFGLTFVSALLLDHQVWIRLVGGLFLCYLGVRTFLAPTSAGAQAEGAKRVLEAYGSTFLLTITNPLTILSFAAVFAGLGVVEAEADPWTATSLVAGVFAGSTLWWLALTSAVRLVRRQLEARAIRWVNRISGVVVAGFGIVSLWSIL